MAKKYMTACDYELLNEFGLPYFKVCVNNRCYRTIYADGTISDFDEVLVDEFGNNVNTFFISSDDFRTIIRDNDINLNVIASTMESERIILYYNALRIMADKDTSKFYLKKIQMKILEITGDEIVCSFERSSKINFDALLKAIEKYDIENAKLNKIISNFKLLNESSLEYLKEYISLINVNELFFDENFIKKHIELTLKFMSNSQSIKNIATLEELCEKMDIPNCLSKFLEDGYLKIVSKNSWNSNYRMFDKYPIEIIGCFVYYFETKQFSSAIVFEFMRNFPVCFFNSNQKIVCTINFIRKNIFLKEKMFKMLKNVFEYVDINSLPITENFISLKYWNNCLAHENLNHMLSNETVANEFHDIRETQGIVHALKMIDSFLKN